jgi:predicted nuclease with TOPRIM domain
LTGVAVGVGETSEEDAKKVYELKATLREKQARLEELEKENIGLKEQLTRLSASADGTPFF